MKISELIHKLEKIRIEAGGKDIQVVLAVEPREDVDPDTGVGECEHVALHYLYDQPVALVYTETYDPNDPLPCYNFNGTIADKDA